MDTFQVEPQFVYPSAGVDEEDLMRPIRVNRKGEARAELNDESVERVARRVVELLEGR
jgi:hypothetical protein